MPARFRIPRVVGLSTAFAVGIGYMDPGNWATDLDAARYGVTLLWAILGSGVAAVGLQILVVRYATEARTNLMEGIVARWPSLSGALWFAYAFAIVATEVAEFIGLVIGLQLMLRVEMSVAVAIGLAIFLALLFAGGTTRRGFEALAIYTTSLLAIVYAIDVAMLHPAVEPIIRGMFIPQLIGPGALVAVVGIVGATIMPHNLFLQSEFVLQGSIKESTPGGRGNHRLVRSLVVSTIIALGIATVVNVAILVVGSATHATTIETAYAALRPFVGNAAVVMFGAALIAAALAATASGACAGDVICHAKAPFRMNRFQRRIAAVVPAAVLLMAGVPSTALLLLSQIALGMVLPAVIIPLIALVIHVPRMRTRFDTMLLGCTCGILVATVACDGILLQSLLPHS